MKLNGNLDSFRTWVEKHKRFFTFVVFKFTAMVSLLDKSVGKVIAALREKKMLHNSIVVFMSDNGAQTQGVHANHGSNYPLRGVSFYLLLFFT